MDRSETLRRIESRLFEFESPEPLNDAERYAVSPTERRDGKTVYVIIGSAGSQVVLSVSQTLPDEPFVILRSLPCSLEDRLHRYQAITLSALEELCEHMYAWRKPQQMFVT